MGSNMAKSRIPGTYSYALSTKATANNSPKQGSPLLPHEPVHCQGRHARLHEADKRAEALPAIEKRVAAKRLSSGHPAGLHDFES